MLKKDHALSCTCQPACAPSRTPPNQRQALLRRLRALLELHCMLDAVAPAAPGTTKSGTHCSYPPLSCSYPLLQPDLTWLSHLLKFAVPPPQRPLAAASFASIHSRVASETFTCCPHVFFGGLFSSSWSTMAGSCMSDQQSAVSAGGHAHSRYQLHGTSSALMQGRPLLASLCTR
jgi:hypothetical protein